MADYSRFDPAIVPWLKQVWKDRQEIKEDAETISRRMGAETVYALYSAGTMNGSDSSFLDFQGELKVLEWFFHISSTCPDESPDPDSFFHFVDPSYRAGSRRIYARVTEPWNKNWTEVARFCLRNMTHGRKDITEFKVAGPRAARTRRDQIVIYLDNQKAVETVIEEMQVKMPGWFEGSLPPGVKCVISGLGWSAEPTPAEHRSPAVDEIWKGRPLSFGSYLAAVIYMALEQSWTGDDENKFVEELITFFLNVGVDPAKPHLLRTISWTELKQLAAVSNAQIVTARIAPTTTVLIDQTSPLPLPTSSQ
jgi:hypothetical protein